MTITRDAEVPVEVGQLMSAFNRVADGSEAITVLNASLHMLAAAIGFVAKSEGLTIGETQAYAAEISQLVWLSVHANWDRPDSATDIEVKPQ
jgi:hypothetical protein